MRRSTWRIALVNVLAVISVPLLLGGGAELALRPPDMSIRLRCWSAVSLMVCEAGG